MLVSSLRVLGRGIMRPPSFIQHDTILIDKLSMAVRFTTLEFSGVYTTVLVPTRSNSFVFVSKEGTFVGKPFCKGELTVPLSLPFDKATDVSRTVLPCHDSSLVFTFVIYKFAIILASISVSCFIENENEK